MPTHLTKAVAAGGSGTILNDDRPANDGRLPPATPARFAGGSISGILLQTGNNSTGLSIYILADRSAATGQARLFGLPPQMLIGNLENGNCGSLRSVERGAVRL